MCRTLADFVIAIGHIVAAIFKLSAAETDGTKEGCEALGVVNEIALVASNLWYVMLALDLLKAIRNPFRYSIITTVLSQCSYHYTSIVVIVS